MKIGLLTVYSFNYGSYYQAVALQMQLTDMGHECELIHEAFKKNEWMNLFLLYTFHHCMPTFLRPAICKILPQYNTFLQLQTDVEKLLQSPEKVLKMEEISKRYDCIVLGSDELWSANPASIRYTPAYFGYGITCPHITYAPSGTLFEINNEELCKKVKNGINSYEQIAVRDVYTRDMVEKVTGRKVPVVLDPTLLNPFFASPDDRKVKGEYILVYGQDYDEEQRKLVRDIAEKKQMKIMALGWPQDWTDGFLNPDTAQGFQDAFLHAAFSFPSTFHGTIFSILHQRPFVSMLNPLRGGKVKMLLEQLQLEDRIYSTETKGHVEEEIDYNKVFDYLDKLRQASLRYLTNALNLVDNKEYEIVPKKECCGCTACMNICPKEAIQMEQDQEGFLYPEIKKELCIKCGRCKQICPMIDRRKKEEANFPMHQPKHIYAVKHKDGETRRLSSSGGVFSLLSDLFLEKKGTGRVAGAVFDDDFRVVTSLVDSLQDRDKMRGSKYVQSDLGNIFSQIRNELQEHKQVLFTGTPCQCDGLRHYLGREYDKLYLCDIVCHGTPSPKVWLDYLKWQEKIRGQKIKKVSFRDKYFGWHKQAIHLEFADGSEYRNTTNKDPFYIMFFSHVCHRPSCHDCQYASYERCSDLTIGDFWGIEDAKAVSSSKITGDNGAANIENYEFKDFADETGTSLVFANTEKGEKLLQRMGDQAMMKESDRTSCYQAIFEAPPKPSPARNAFWRLYQEQGYEKAAAIYGKLTFKQKVIKLVIAPAAKKCGIYNLAQRIYFGPKKK